MERLFFTYANNIMAFIRKRDTVELLRFLYVYARKNCVLTFVTAGRIFGIWIKPKG